MKILFVGIVPCTFDPHRHSVRSIRPGYTAFRPRRSTVHVESFEVLPRVTQRHIARPRSADTQFGNTYRLVLHISAVAGTAGFAEHKGELKSRLADVRPVPVGQLHIVLELITPMLEMRVG